MPANLRWLFPLLLVALVRPAGAFIEKLYSLDEVMKESSHIVTGRIEKIDPKQKAIVASVDKAFKGPADFKTIQMNIGVGPAHHAAYLMDRIKPGAEFILFYRREGPTLASLVHAGDTWFQLFATDNPKARDKVWWRMSHVEIAMGRTYNGATVELVKLIGDVLAKRAKAPPPDKSVPRLNLEALAKRVQSPDPAVRTGGFHRQFAFKHAGGAEIRGISWADVNGDGLWDALFCRQQGNLLLLNQPGGWRDATAQLGLTGGTRAAAWADYDGDDHPDLLTSSFQLFTSAGARLKDDTKLLAAPAQRDPKSGGWIDYNGDGRPDVLIANGAGGGLRLLENTGKGPGWFRDVSDKAGLGAGGLGAGSGNFLFCFDFDNDGLTDFFYNVGEGLLARNDGNGAFKAVSGSGLRLAGDQRHKRGLAVADFDNDGDLDLFVPGPGKAQLYRNNNDGTFSDVVDASGDLAKAGLPSFSAAWGDVNNDGFLDLLVCHLAKPPRLYLGNGRGQFQDISEATGLTKLPAASAASFADVDNDGDLDVALNLSDRVVVAINEMARPAQRTPLLVRPMARRGLIGARVRVLDERGKLVGLRELNGAEGCGGQSWPVAHFAVMPGKWRVAVALSDGRLAQKTAEVGAETTTLVFGDDEFE